MKQILVDLYEFDELDDEIKKEVLDQYRDINMSDFSERFSEYLTEYLEERGLPTKETPFSLNYCQGDGVAFYGVIDIPKYLSFYERKTKYRSLKNLVNGDAAIWCERNSFGYHYSHANTMKIEYETYVGITKKQEELLLELIKEIETTLKEESKNLERIGYGWIEEDVSDDVVKEIIQLNEYLFLSNGKRFSDGG